MRYFTQGNVVFTNRGGESYEVKPMREIPSYVTIATLPINGTEYLDEIASRPEVYGDDMESMAYAIFEHNVKDIVNAGFDLTKIQSLKIPNIEGNS